MGIAVALGGGGGGGEPPQKTRGEATAQLSRMGEGEERPPPQRPILPQKKKDRQCHAKTRQKKKTEWKSSPHMLSTGEHRGVTRGKRGKGTTKLLTGEKFD